MKTSKVLLVNPPYVKKVYPALKKAPMVQIPLGLAYLAAALEEKKLSVEVLDANILYLSDAETVRRILESDADIVGFTATTASITTVYNLAKGVRAKSNKTVIVGGPHTTFLTERTFRECSAIDIIARGEGEITIVELAQNKPLSKIKGISYKDKRGKVKINEDRPMIMNLDSLPRPARHLFPWDLYQGGAFFNVGTPDKKVATLLTARGCNNKCTYCASSHYWKIMRWRSPENVVDEIEYLIKEKGVEQIAFLDDTFVAWADRTEKICDLIIERKLKFKWWCYARVRGFAPSLIKKMKKAGCYALNFGVESGNQDLLNRMKKNITKKEVWDAITAAKENGLMVHASFMVGLPGDTKKTVMQTINWAIKLSPDVALFCIVTPFPGTELHDEAKRSGWIKENVEWDQMGLHMHTNFHNDDLSNKEIYNLYKLATRKFYFRPRFFLQLADRILKNPLELKGYILAGLYMIFEG
jgi:anaerobic magnesium-protoporphyrin IX monomethyl ester cyclase